MPDSDSVGRELLISFVDHQRERVLWKIQGLNDEQLRWKHQPSGLCLLGLLKHLTLVEQTWFQHRLMGLDIEGGANDESAWNPGPAQTVDLLVTRYREAWATSNDIARQVSLDQPIVYPSVRYGVVTAGWVLLHMLEEIARHLGHIDLIRETIDGTVGDIPPEE